MTVKLLFVWDKGIVKGIVLITVLHSFRWQNFLRSFYAKEVRAGLSRIEHVAALERHVGGNGDDLGAASDSQATGCSFSPSPPSAASQSS